MKHCGEVLTTLAVSPNLHSTAQRFMPPTCHVSPKNINSPNPLYDRVNSFFTI